MREIRGTLPSLPFPRVSRHNLHCTTCPSIVYIWTNYYSYFTSLTTDKASVCHPAVEVEDDLDDAEVAAVKVNRWQVRFR